LQSAARTCSQLLRMTRPTKKTMTSGTTNFATCAARCAKLLKAFLDRVLRRGIGAQRRPYRDLRHPTRRHQDHPRNGEKGRLEGEHERQPGKRKVGLAKIPRCKQAERSRKSRQHAEREA